MTEEQFKELMEELREIKEALVDVVKCLLEKTDAIQSPSRYK